MVFDVERDFNMEVKRKRDSSLELFRVTVMMCIVAHHYIVNSGVLSEITQQNVLKWNSLFSLLFGWGGKTGINCFVLITGYFMCKSNISWRKFFKLFLEIEFYKIVIYIIFLTLDRENLNIKSLLKVCLPIYGIGTGFTNSYLLFFLFIPFLNILINAMDEREHLLLIGVCLLGCSLVQTFLFASNSVTYVGWFMVLYFIAAYIRIYPKKIFKKREMWVKCTIISWVLSWGSILIMAWIYHETGHASYYFFVSDSNKLLAIVMAVSSFLLFNNLNLSYNPLINKMGAATFGVLLIHANSDAMRSWLWSDFLKNKEFYHSNLYIRHAILSVVLVYLVCTIIDCVRIDLLERPFFNWYDKKQVDNKIHVLSNKLEEKMFKF